MSYYVQYVVQKYSIRTKIGTLAPPWPCSRSTDQSLKYNNVLREVFSSLPYHFIFNMLLIVVFVSIKFENISC